MILCPDIVYTLLKVISMAMIPISLLLAQDTPKQLPGQGKPRMTQLSDQQKEEIQSMASPNCMDADERKRQYAAMGRAIHKEANPTLLAKYQLCSDTERFGSINIFSPMMLNSFPYYHLKMVTKSSLTRWTMLKQWLLNDGKTDCIDVEEKYVRWTEELRSDRYTTATRLKCQIINSIHKKHILQLGGEAFLLDK